MHRVNCKGFINGLSNPIDVIDVEYQRGHQKIVLLFDKSRIEVSFKQALELIKAICNEMPLGE